MHNISIKLDTVETKLDACLKAQQQTTIEVALMRQHINEVVAPARERVDRIKHKQDRIIIALIVLIVTLGAGGVYAGKSLGLLTGAL